MFIRAHAKKRSAQPTLYTRAVRDLVIIGAGPAGLSAAIWARTLGLSPLLLERASEAGGQLLRIFRDVTDFPGVIAPDGRLLSDRFLAHARHMQVEFRLGANVAKLEAAARKLTLTTGETIDAGAIIVASGVRPRPLGVPGEAHARTTFHGAREAFVGRRAVVIGSGDAAVENATAIAAVTKSVTLIARGSALRARSSLRELLPSTVDILSSTRVESIERESDTLIVRVQGPRCPQRIVADAVLVKIGNLPNTEAFGELQRQKDGRIAVNAKGHTSAAGVFAAGEVADGVLPRIVTAAADGAIAAREAAAFLGRW